MHILELRGTKHPGSRKPYSNPRFPWWQVLTGLGRIFENDPAEDWCGMPASVVSSTTEEADEVRLDMYLPQRSCPEAVGS